MDQSRTKTENVDQEELLKFSALAAHWWDTLGELRTLHQINPLRLSFINEKIALAEKKVLDIGCGGGILTESMAQAGALVTGIDMNPTLIEVAKLHQLESGTSVHYATISAEAHAETHAATYDVITCLEMLEHVPKPLSVIKAIATLVKPGGHVFFSTLNRNLKSYLQAIIGAEYILRLLPKNTHDYAKFIRPAELSNWCKMVNLHPKDMRGITYNPLSKQFKLTDNVSVNYLFYAIHGK